MNTHVVGAHSLTLTEGAKKLCHFPATAGFENDQSSCAGPYLIS